MWDHLIREKLNLLFSFIYYLTNECYEYHSNYENVLCVMLLRSVILFKWHAFVFLLS